MFGHLSSINVLTKISVASVIYQNNTNVRSFSKNFQNFSAEKLETVFFTLILFYPIFLPLNVSKSQATKKTELSILKCRLKAYK